MIIFINSFFIIKFLSLQLPQIHHSIIFSLQIIWSCLFFNSFSLYIIIFIQTYYIINDKIKKFWSRIIQK